MFQTFFSDFFVNIIKNIFLQGIQLLLSFDWYHLQFDSKVVGVGVGRFFFVHFQQLMER